MYTQIKAKKDLYNAGKCFTKDQLYDLESPVNIPPSLMERSVINDQGERHLIGSWWREFALIK